MSINFSSIVKKDDQKVKAVYEDCSNFYKVPDASFMSVAGLCFYGNKMVIVNNKGNWEPPCGHIEKDEKIEEALIREVQEESNMKVLHYIPIGFLRTLRDDGEGEYWEYQARYFCVVKPYGPFISDPAGDITEIKLIHPKDYKKYFDWGEVSEHIMQKAFSFLQESKQL